MRNFTLFLILVSYMAAFPISVNALPSSKCVEKVLDNQDFSGTVSKVFEEENTCNVIIRLGDEDWTVAISCGERNQYEALKGKAVNVSYRLVQFWDDHDDECLRREEIVKIAPK